MLRLAPAITCAAASIAIHCASGRAAAQTPAPASDDSVGELDITWDGPPSCDGGAELRSKVARLLSGSQRSASQRVKIEVAVRHEKDGRFIAELRTSGAGGEGKRLLESESCEALTLASAVVIALSIDPNASLDASPPPIEPQRPRVELTPAPRRPPPKRPPPPPPRETFPFWYGAVGALFEARGVPSAFTATGIGVRHQRWSFELGGALHQPRDAVSSSRSSAGAELRLLGGELLGCHALLPFSIGALDSCIGLRVEHLKATAFGVTDPAEGIVLLGSALLVARGRLRATTWLSAVVDVGLLARPFHPTFVLVGVGNVYDVPALAPFARTGLVLEL